MRYLQDSLENVPPDTFPSEIRVPEIIYSKIVFHEKYRCSSFLGVITIYIIKKISSVETRDQKSISTRNQPLTPAVFDRENIK